MLSARELSITWAGNPLYWSWKPLLQSRFAEVVELRTITWLEIHGKINTRMISAKTVYGAYLIVKFANRAYGLDSLPSEVSIEVGDVKVQGTVYLRCQENKKQDLDRMYFLNRVQALRSRVSRGGEGERVVSEREDGWLSLVSSTARSVSDSDIVWEDFPPSDYQEILSRLVWKVVYSSKKLTCFSEFFIRIINK
ncbi:hypothetical protein LWI28_021353 [Acer negundo]|uniref:Uncharacterized protein n=1 Tax=Acer negundo TaxID=4023 RepID=A0AAD5NXD1_ACENE|nr:hypothetical protein LWI28_021353 [Acer negundo]